MMRIQSLSPELPSVLYSSALCGAPLLPWELPVWIVTELNTKALWNNLPVIFTVTTVSNTQHFIACYKITE